MSSPLKKSPKRRSPKSPTKKSKDKKEVPLKISFASGSKSSTSFVLQVDPTEVEKELGLQAIFTTNTRKKKNETETDDRTINFLDPQRQSKTWITTMRHIREKKPLNELMAANTRCFNDHHPFETHPIGCPVSYHPSVACKTYFSEIDKHEITEKKEISSIDVDKYKNNGWEIDQRDYFLVDGFFCSFNCVLNFIRNNRHIAMYEHSEMLLYKLYQRLVGKHATKIIRAGDFCLLKEYGGHLSIEKYRAEFETVEYRNTYSNYHGYPRQFPLGRLYDVVAKF